MLRKIKIDKHTFSLLFLVISTFLLSQSYSVAISFAQTESVLVCDFVQYCSNPVELSTSNNDSSTAATVTPETEAQTTAESEAQTAPDSTELLPDVTSNISLIMTPDLPGNLAEEVSQDSLNQDLLAANDTQQISSNATLDSQLVVPENATVITPDAQIPLESTTENISMTIQDDNGTITADSGSSNQSEIATTIPPDNATMSIDDSNMSQVAPVNETIDTTAGNETIDTTAGNETIDTTAGNETIDTTAGNETIDTTAGNETISPATSDVNQSTATNETISPATSDVNQSTATNETISPATSDVNQQNSGSNVNEVQSNSGPNSENQTAPPSFLDPLINPFKELFGIK